MCPIIISISPVLILIMSLVDGEAIGSSGFSMGGVIGASISSLSHPINDKLVQNLLFPGRGVTAAGAAALPGIPVERRARRTIL